MCMRGLNLYAMIHAFSAVYMLQGKNVIRLASKILICGSLPFKNIVLASQYATTVLLSLMTWSICLPPPPQLGIDQYHITCNKDIQ